MPSAIASRPNETKLIHSVVGKMVMLVIKAVWQEDALGHVRAGGECACFHQAWHCLHKAEWGSHVLAYCSHVVQSSSRATFMSIITTKQDYNS